MYYYHDIVLRTAPGVYPPSDDSLLLADNIDPNGRVLEVGTGSGIVAIHLAKKGHRVVATDINPRALALTRENSRLNGVEDNLDVVRADLLRGLRGPFDTIVFNAPYLPSRPLGKLGGIGELGTEMDLKGPHARGTMGQLGRFSPGPPQTGPKGNRDSDPLVEERPPVGSDNGPQDRAGDISVDISDDIIEDVDRDVDDWLSRAWKGGMKGAELTHRFLGELSRHLDKGGRGYIVVSSMTDFKLPVDSELDFRVVAERKFPFEMISVLELFKRTEEAGIERYDG